MKRIICARVFVRVFSCVVIGLLVFVASMCFYVKRTDNMDFVRIQDLMYPIRNTNISLYEYLFTNAGKELNQTLNFTYTFNILLFFTSKLSDNQYILPWLSAIIDYCVIASIYYDWKKEQKWSIGETISAFFICMAFLPFVHVLSGIRAAMAACFMALAVYKYIYRNSSVLFFILFAFLSVTVHPFTVYAVPVALLVRFSPSIKTFIIVLVGTLALIYIVPILGRMGIPFVSNLAIKFFTYIGDNQYTSYRSFYYSSILCALLLVMYYILFLRTRNKNGIIAQKDKLYKFVVCYSAVIIGSFGSYETVCRLAYVLGALSPILSEMLLTLWKKDNGRYVIARIIFFVFLALSIYTFGKHIRYYGGFFSLGNIAISTNPALQ